MAALRVEVDRAPTDELLEMWRRVLKAGARQMLDVLVEAYRAGAPVLTYAELADRVGMVASGGTFQTYVSTLRRNGLAEASGGDIRASDALFLGDGS